MHPWCLCNGGRGRPKCRRVCVRAQTSSRPLFSTTVALFVLCDDLTRRLSVSMDDEPDEDGVDDRIRRRELFEGLDVDGDGFLSEHDIVEGMSRLGIPTQRSIIQKLVCRDVGCWGASRLPIRDACFIFGTQQPALNNFHFR